MIARHLPRRWASRRWATIPASILFALLTAQGATVHPAAGAEDPKRAEAKARFDRGIALLEENDDAGALAELLRAYQLIPERQTLLMVGVTQAMMNRSVEAVATFDKVLADPGALSQKQLNIARQRRAEQTRKVARLRVTTNAPANIEIDGVSVGQTPSDAPFPVAAGTRIVAALGAGHLPARKEITIATGVTADLHFDLAPSQLQSAHLFVRSNLPDADVLVDGQRVGRTPLPGSITVAPGTRTVELRRPGYETSRATLPLGDGATAELPFAPAELPDADVPRGKLVLEISEPEAEILIDGQAGGIYRAPLTLPSGRHLVRVVRGGFVAADRMLEIPAGGEARVPVTLQPTPEARVAYVDHARSARRWAMGGAVAGAGLAAGALIFVASNAGSLSDAREQRDQVLATFAPGGSCDVRGGGDHFRCELDLDAANAAVNRHSLRRTLGIVALGVGVVTAAVGSYLLYTGDDPARYDRPRRLGAGFDLALDFAPDAAGQGGSLILGGRF